MGRVKRSGEREVFFSSLPLPPFLLSPSHLPLRLLVLLSPIFYCHKIKDGGYNNTNTNKVSPTQNTPALQAIAGRVYEQGKITRIQFKVDRLRIIVVAKKIYLRARLRVPTVHQ